MTTKQLILVSALEFLLIGGAACEPLPSVECVLHGEYEAHSYALTPGCPELPTNNPVSYPEPSVQTCIQGLETPEGFITQECENQHTPVERCTGYVRVGDCEWTTLTVLVKP